MFNIFKKKEKLYKVTKVFNIYSGEEEEVNEITNQQGLKNMVVNGFEILESEEI
jgi:hypothetical protein